MTGKPRLYKSSAFFRPPLIATLQFLYVFSYCIIFWLNKNELNWTERLAKIWNLGNVKLQTPNCKLRSGVFNEKPDAKGLYLSDLDWSCCNWWQQKLTELIITCSKGHYCSLHYWTKHNYILLTVGISGVLFYHFVHLTYRPQRCQDFLSFTTLAFGENHRTAWHSGSTLNKRGGGHFYTADWKNKPYPIYFSFTWYG